MSRYKALLNLPRFGAEGLQRLRDASVLVVGCGGLGSPVLMYLAAAGVGRLGLMDCDTVDVSNLGRQIIHSTPAIGMPKVESAARRLEALNPEVQLTLHPERLTPTNADAIVSKYDFVVEATDNFDTKYLVNDACLRTRRPFCIGGVERYRGQTLTVVPLDAETSDGRSHTTDYRAVFPAPFRPDECVPCSELGIFSTVPGVIGMIQATEALKYLARVGNLLTDRLLVFDAEALDFQIIELAG